MSQSIVNLLLGVSSMLAGALSSVLMFWYLLFTKDDRFLWPVVLLFGAAAVFLTGHGGSILGWFPGL